MIDDLLDLNAAKIIEIKNTYLDDSSASLLLSQYLPD